MYAYNGLRPVFRSFSVRAASVRIALLLALVISWLSWATSPIAAQIVWATASIPSASSAGVATLLSSLPGSSPYKYSGYCVRRSHGFASLTSPAWIVMLLLL